MDSSPAPISRLEQTRKNLIIAGLYALAGFAALLLTHTSGYASPLWPAAGIAVAGLLAWGWRCWPGVWFGSLLTHLWLDPSLQGAGIAALLATATSLQALLAAALAQRYLRGNWTVAGDRGLAVCLLVAGPLSCTVAASLGCAVLFTAGRVAGESLLNEWLIWWSGDTLGLLLFAPLARLLWPGAHPLRIARVGNYRFAMPLLITAILLVVGHLGLSQLEELRARSEARKLMEVIGDSGTRELAETIYPLVGLAHFIAASQEVTREEFRHYTRSFTNHPAILSVDWAPRITGEQRAGFEASVVREGFPAFRISDLDSDGHLRPAAERDEYFPILFSGPLTQSHTVLGLDHAFELPRREAMNVARGNGQAIASDLIQLVRTDRHAALVYIPVYHLSHGVPAQQLTGFVVGVLDIEELFAPLLNMARERQFDLRISDVTPGNPRRDIVGSLPTGAHTDWSYDFHIGERTWRLEMEPEAPLWQPGSTTEERLFLGFSIFTAFLAAFATLSSAERHSLVSHQVAERTAQLRRELEMRTAAERALIESEEQRSRFFALSLDLFCIAGTDGFFRSVNPAFTRTLGWSEEELLARPLVDFVHPEDVARTHAQIELIAQGRSTLDFENRYHCKDGSWRWLAWKALPQPGGLMFCTAHDTTAQHLAAEQLRSLNSELEQRIEERSQALLDLHAKKEEIRAVLDHLLECVVTIDEHGVVRSVNPAIEPLLGYHPEELIGRNISCLMAPPQRDEHDGYLEHYLRTGVKHIIGFSREVSARHRDGHAVDLELSVSEYSAHGERFFIGTLRDIREQKALIASLTQAREGAEQASRAKSAFLATMSHEIRTPMNGVVGLIDVLAQDHLPPYQADLIKAIRESSSNLLGVIDNILDFSRIEAGKLEIERAPLQLAELVDNLCNTLKPLASSQGVTLTHTIAPGIPQWVTSDAMRLRQILYNLLGNAIKFSSGRSDRPGQIVVQAPLVNRQPLRLAIRVADNGIGIAPEHLDNLFSPFTQAETSTTRRFGGSGLGLAICQRLVELLDGEIRVASTLGSGTLFNVELPLEPAVAPTPVEGPATTGDESLASRPEPDAPSRRHILVVEDDTLSRKVIQLQLALFGYRFDMASNGAEALAMWRAGDYDLILSDLHMPEMDGYQLAERIRGEETGRRRTPILALTANALRGEAARAHDAGMDEYLTKPIRLTTLRAALERWLPGAIPAMRSEAADAQTVPASLLDPAALSALVGEDHQLIREILGDYRNALGSLTGQLLDAFGNGDLTGVGALAHRLKSSSRAVGATRLGQLCAMLEQAVKSGDHDSLERGIAEFTPLCAATGAGIEQLLEAGNPAEQEAPR
ncbi:PAS domain S-box protein [Ectopseudomonas oleovorans]|uniref:PAS domain S-box protein n=1 Tax=Ectopseudomonas oleovorans TaxID=301 RepID=UPI00142E066B|nr:PAS domain S-box protein [Pseudomonas indoloxydans]